MTLREEHLRLAEVGVPGRGRLLVSAGVRGAPGLAPGLAELLATLPPLEGRVLDLTASAGAGVYAAGPETDVLVLEPSAAGARAARATFAADDHATVAVGLPWDAPAAAFDAAVLAPPADRGNERVRAEIAAAAAALAPGGVAYMVGHKDLGAKRYEREAAACFDRVEVLSRQRGWRVARLSAGRPRGQDVPWSRFPALGRGWWALPGVFAGGRLDQGSAALLRALLGAAPDAGEDALAAALAAGPPAGTAAADLAAAAVLDLGCGTGTLSWAASRAGARAVVGLDDDLAAVRSAERNLAGEVGAEGAGSGTAHAGPAAVRGAGRDVAVAAGPHAGVAGSRIVHADLDAGLEPDALFDVVLMNPPFHLGKQVRVTLGRTFLEVAHRRLRAGGWVAVVANRALPYEVDLQGWARWETLAQHGPFKVLRAWR